jgi:hypothetical protein
MTLQHLEPEPATWTAGPFPATSSPAAAVRQLPCTMCWALAGQPCQDHPAGDHLRRWTDAREAALITRTDLAAAVTGLPVITAWTIVPAAPALVIADMVISYERPASTPDPGLFAALTDDESGVLIAHLSSGWHKQGVVYPTLSLAWWETSALMDDIHQARQDAYPARQAARRDRLAGQLDEGEGR